MKVLTSNRSTCVAVMTVLAGVSQGFTCDSLPPDQEVSIRVLIGGPGGIETNLGSNEFGEGLFAVSCYEELPGEYKSLYDRCEHYTGLTPQTSYVLEAVPDDDGEFEGWRCGDTSDDVFTRTVERNIGAAEGTTVTLQASVAWCGAVFSAKPAAAVGRTVSLTVDGQVVDPEVDPVLPEFAEPTIVAVVRDDGGAVLDPAAFEYAWRWRSAAAGEGGSGPATTFEGRTEQRLAVALLNDLEVTVTVRDRSLAGAGDVVGTESVRLAIDSRISQDPGTMIALQNAAPIPAAAYAPGERVDAGVEVFDGGAGAFVALSSEAWAQSEWLLENHGALEGVRLTLVPDYGAPAGAVVVQTRALGGFDEPPGLLSFEVPPETVPGTYYLYLDVAASEVPETFVGAFEVDPGDHVGRLVWSFDVVDG